MPKQGGNNSAIIIARLLDSEGFSAYTAQQVKRYSLRNATDQQAERYEKVKKRFSEIMKSHSLEERMLIGAYIRILQKMAFDSGLKIGLTAYAVECEEKRKE